MRQGFGGGLQIENNKLVGINLGSDFTAEHEWGIQTIQNIFGINQKENLLGIAQREITRFPSFCRHFTSKVNKVNVDHFLCESFFSNQNLENYNPFINFNDEPMATQWCSSGFGIHVTKDKQYKHYLKELYSAFKNLDGAIFFVSESEDKNLFERPGLFLAIKSRISKKDIQQMYDVDYDYNLLLEESSKTKIKDLLKEAGKDYFALSPRWAKDIHHIKTSYKVAYWLNPLDQKSNNAGWYSVEDLKKWIHGVGPIPKEKVSLAKELIIEDSL